MGSSVLSEKGGSRRGHRTHVGAWQTCARMGGRRVECLKTYRMGGGGVREGTILIFSLVPKLSPRNFPAQSGVLPGPCASS